MNSDTREVIKLENKASQAMSKAADGIRTHDVQLGKKDPVFSRNLQKPNVFSMLAPFLIFASLRISLRFIAFTRSILAKKWSN